MDPLRPVDGTFQVLPARHGGTVDVEDSVDASVLAPGGALDKIIAASATGDSDAAAIARGFLRSILIGIEDETNGFARLVVEKTTTHVDVRKRKIDTGSRKRARSDV